MIQSQDISDKAWWRTLHDVARQCDMFGKPHLGYRRV